MALRGFLLQAEHSLPWEGWHSLLWVEAAIARSQRSHSGVCREQPALCPCAAGSAPQRAPFRVTAENVTAVSAPPLCASVEEENTPGRVIFAACQVQRCSRGVWGEGAICCHLARCLRGHRARHCPQPWRKELAVCLLGCCLWQGMAAGGTWW